MSKLKVSKMSGKLDGIQAMNTSPLDNPFCVTRHNNNIGVCGECYSQNMCKTFRANAAKVWKRNGDILSKEIIPDESLPRFSTCFVRFSAHGELINETHLINLLNMAKKNPRSTFSIWTKRPQLFRRVIDKHGKPDNLIAIFSVTEINYVPMRIPSGFDKVFCVVTEGSEYASMINCGDKKCIDCELCYTRNNTDVIIEKLKTRRNGAS